MPTEQPEFKNPQHFFVWKVRAYREGRTNQVRMRLANIRMEHNKLMWLVGLDDRYAWRAHSIINDREF
jgi:hypothetical protein